MTEPQQQQQPFAQQQLADSIAALLAPAADLRRVAADGRLQGRRVLFRADLNLPLKLEGSSSCVTDATRLDAIMPTLQLLLQGGARVVLCSHLGRPDPSTQDAQQMRQHASLAPVAALLQERLGAAAFTGLVPDCVGAAAAAAVSALAPGQACLLENLRFNAGEAANDAGFARQLAALGCDTYVSDAFGVLHRDQASITALLPHMAACYPGLLLRSELTYLHSTCNHPVRPFGVIIGGAKVRDKLPVVRALIDRADVLCIGGRMAFTFLAAEGVAVGRTQIEHEWLEPCREMRQLARERGVQMLLPQDVVVARSLDDDAGCCTVPLTVGCCSQEAPCVPEGCFGLDVGPKTAAAFETAVLGCKTLFWNGPMGRCEVPGFAAGTHAVAAALGKATAGGATTVIGGGDSVSAVKQMQPPPAVSFISTGGGAGLALIRGSNLPGIAALAQALQRGAPQHE